jgi:serine protease Do
MRGLRHIASLAVVLLLAVCAANKSAEAQISCAFISSRAELATCMHLAQSGDTQAMMGLARSYRNGLNLQDSPAQPPTHIDADPGGSLRYYRMAAQAGDQEAILHLYNLYLTGNAVPKDQTLADAYADQAAQAGVAWALLVRARRQEATSPGVALNTYLKLARQNNCFAQWRLAQAYARGDIAPRNPAQAYFWLLLSKVDAFQRQDNAPAERGDVKYTDCASFKIGDVGLQVNLENALSPASLQAAKNAAANWVTGSVESDLPAPAGRMAQAPAFDLSRARTETAPQPSSVGKSDYDLASAAVPWVPEPRDNEPSQLRGNRSAQDLFARTRPSVWVVIATDTPNPTAVTPVSLGSAVAVSPSHLLTSYHVVESEHFISIKQGAKLLAATIVAVDKKTDRCILAVRTGALTPVAGLRPFERLKVGEPVYTIGSPSGLENTLGTGIISGLRTVDGMHFVQTNAQISPGSSGGGLFDGAGDLIGITEFTLKNSQGLNFAIAAEDYFR